MQQNWLFGGVYGAVLSSALLAALHSEGTPFTPYYNAAWILVTMRHRRARPRLRAPHVVPEAWAASRAEGN